MVNDNDDDFQRAATKDKNGNYIFDIPLVYEPDELGLGNQLFHCMRKHKNRIAQYISETDEEDTYEEVLRRSVRTALHLQERNLTKDDVVVLCSNNQKHSVVPFLASIFLAVPVASLDPSLSVMDVSHLMKEVKPKILFVIPEFLEIIETSLSEAGIDAEIVVIGETDKHTEFSSFLEPHEDEKNFVPVPVDSLDDTVVILFSSGTTGLPKGIMVNNYALQVQGHILYKYNNVGPVNLTYATLYWISSILFTIATIQTGAAKVLTEKFNPKEIWYLISKYQVSVIFLAPAHGIAMIKVGRPDGVDTTSLWTCITGGASFPEKQLLELRDLLPGAFIFQAYGQSEVTGALTVFRTNDVRETLLLHAKPRSVGLPVAGFKCKVVNTETEEMCSPNEHGELRVKSRCVMNGYYNRDSSGCYDSDGWLKTGDIVYFDDDGCFYIVDRLKEILKYRSLHVPPAMLEQVIMTHPAVSQVVVIGIPDEEDGDHPMALIIPNEKYEETIDEEEIKKFVEDRVPDRMRLRGGTKIIKSFALTPSGKIKRNELRDMVLRGEI